MFSKEARSPSTHRKSRFILILQFICRSQSLLIGEQSDGVVEQVVVEVFVDVQHEVQVHLVRSDQPLGCHLHLAHVSSRVLGLDYRGCVEARDVEVGPAGGLPGFGGDDLFPLVVDVVDGSGERKPLLVGEGVEGRDLSEVVVVHEHAIPLAGEGELGLPYDLFPDIEDVVVVDCVVRVVVRAVAVADQHVDVGLSFPHVAYLKRQIVDVVVLDERVLHRDGPEFAGRVALQVEGEEVDAGLELGLPPRELRVVVHLLEAHVGIPLSLRFEGRNFLHILTLIAVISKEQSVVAGVALLHNGEQLGVREDEDVHGRSVLESVVVRIGAEGVGEQVHDFNRAFADVHDDGLPLIEHAEGVNRVNVVPLPKDLALLVDVHQLLIGPWDGGDVEEAVDGGAQLEDLLGRPFELGLLGVLDEEHAILIYARIITR